jgi:gas vesicle protein
MRSFGKFTLGILLGGFVGVGVAFLFAPVSGNRLRGRIYDYFTNIRNEVNKAASFRQQELQEDLLQKQHKI